MIQTERSLWSKSTNNVEIIYYLLYIYQHCFKIFLYPKIFYNERYGIHNGLILKFDTCIKYVPSLVRLYYITTPIDSHSLPISTF